MAMKITAVRIRRVEGEMEHAEPFWEERLVRPVDLYPEHRAEGMASLPRVRENCYRIVAHFVEVETDEGVSGRAGPVAADQLPVIDRNLGPLLVGEDPIAHERLWDRLYRHSVHGRRGVAMMAASALHCA